MSRGLLNRFHIWLLSVAMLCMVGIGTMFSMLAVPCGDGSVVKLVDCARGVPLARVAAELERQGIIRSARLFVLLARLKGDDDRVQAGTYQVHDGMSAVAVLKKMVAGDVYSYRFAVPEGYSIFQLAELLENRRIFSQKDFLAACSDKELLKALGIPGLSVEGYLLPATYDISPRMTPADVITMMVRQFERVFAERFGQHAAMAKRGRHELVTLASLVEKEAVVASERPLIASVFANRLKKRMRLQSDPTAVYGARSFGGVVTHQDLLRKSPYNTYLIDGLPPGPIGNPGAEALQAVLAPARTPYLYFVAKGDGTHFFSTALDQHNKAVTRYLKGAASPGAKRPGAGYSNDHPSLTGGR